MKKIISIFLAALFAMAQPVVFAAPIDNFNSAMSADYQSGELQFSIHFKTNQELAPEHDYLGIGSLNNSSIAYHIWYDRTNSNRMIMKSEATVTPPPEYGLPYTLTYWFDHDMSAPSLTYIGLFPDDTRYHYMITQDEMIFEQVQSPFQLERIKNIEQSIFAKNKNLIKPSHKNGTYTLTLSDSQMKTMAQNATDEIYDIMAPYFMMGISTPEAKADFAQGAVDVFKNLKNVTMFNKDALVLKATLDNHNFLSTMNYEINVKTDLAKVLGIITDDAIFDDTIAPFDATVVLDYAYKNTNQKIDIPFPFLTEDNSLDILAQEVPAPPVMRDNSDLLVVVDHAYVNMDPKPFIENDRTLVPIRALCNALGISDDGINFENGIVTILGQDFNKSIMLTVNSNVAYVDGEEIPLDVPARIVDDRLFVPLRFVTQAFGHAVEFVPATAESSAVIHITKIMPTLFTVLVPDNVQAGVRQLLDITNTLAYANADIVSADHTIFVEKTNIAIAAGEPVVIYDNGILPDTFGEEMLAQGAILPLNDILTNFPDLLAFINENEEVKKAVMTDDGTIYALPAMIDDSLVRFYVSFSVENAHSAASFVDAYTKIVSNMMPVMP